MSPEPPAPEAPRILRLGSLGAVLDALRSPDLGLRMATLAALAADPEKAAAFPAEDGHDLLEELRRLLRSSRPSLFRSAVLAALFAFRDPRALESAQELFRSAEDPESLDLAVRRIAEEADEAACAFLGPFLQSGENRTRQRLAARALAGRPGLEPDDRLRVALLAGETGAEPPPLDPLTLPLWAEHLGGRLRAEARGFLRVQGRSAFRLLAEHAAELDPDTRMWLLSWGAEAYPEDSGGLLAAALASSEAPAQLAALEVLAGNASLQWIHSPALEGVRERSGDPRWNLAAIQAGAQVEDVRSRVFTEPEPAVRQALILRLGRESGAEGVLGCLLEDGDWRARAAATEALARIGESARGPASARLEHADPAVRLAASQVLRRLEAQDLRMGLPSPESGSPP